MNERIAVVIPYFQRQPGLLARAVRSVFDQKGPVDPFIVVVDDSSPLAAESELEWLDDVRRQNVQVIHQPNGGCGNARNTAFDALPDNIPYVALLDADDLWHEDHLDQAMIAMNLGYDFYFCDNCWENDPSGCLARVGIDPAEHTPIAPEREIYAIKGDFFDRLLRRACVPVSTVVMRRGRLGKLRFHPTLRPVAEDLLFWLDAARATDRVAFSMRIAVVYGYGVSLSRLDDWASAKALANITGYFGYFDEVRRRMPLTPEQACLVDERIQKCQWDFVHTMFGMIRRGRWPDPGLVKRFSVRNPRVLTIAPRVLASGFSGRDRGAASDQGDALSP
jgi:succinoglycan biosynthesis protein ExoW